MDLSTTEWWEKFAEDAHLSYGCIMSSAASEILDQPMHPDRHSRALVVHWSNVSVHFLWILSMCKLRPIIHKLIISQSVLCHYENTPIQIYRKFHLQKLTFSEKKKLCYFSYFCSRYRLRRGGSNEYPQSMFLSKTKKNNVNPCKPQFYYIKVGFKGVKII